MKRFAVIPYVLLAVFGASQALAWGGVGHRTVCEIAYQELTDEAKARVNALLAKDDEFSKFADSCTWADGKQQKRKRRTDHFINVPRYYFEVRTGECRLGDRCLFSAIRSDVNVLSFSDDAAEQLEALKYLGHWVGDIHQPLHVSYSDDWGGNKIEQSGGSCRYSLHSVWDGCVITSRLGTDPAKIAKRLLEQVGSQRGQWNDSTMVDWANESYDIARDTKVGYCHLDGQRCKYDSDEYRLDEDDTEKSVVVDAEYLDMAEPIVRERLLMAGVRLGGLLNRIFDPPEYD